MKELFDPVEVKKYNSPLWEPRENADVDDHGVITPHPTWITAKQSRVLTDNDKFCRECLCITIHKDSVCVKCGTHFEFGLPTVVIH